MPKKKLLLVEDVENIRDIYAELLSTDYDVVTAACGETALSLIASENPDLLILDHHMPGLSGEQVYTYLRRNANLPKLPVIFVTGSIFDIEESMNDPFSSTLFKPFKVADLRNEISKFLFESKPA